MRLTARSSLSLPPLLTPAVAALACIVATGGAARADSSSLATQPGVTDATAGVPESGNQTSASFMASTEVDPSTGIMHTSIAIQAPSARGAAQPDVRLSYSSEGGTGYLGTGWSLDVPSIERRTYSGTPTYEALPTAAGTWQPHDLFYFGGERLVPLCIVQSGQCSAVQESFPATVSGWWYFRQEADESFLRFFLSPDQKTWLIQSKSGVTMELGYPLSSSTGSPAPTNLLPPAVEYPSGSAYGTPQYGPYRWSIVRKYDAQSSHGAPINVVYYVWLSEIGSPTTTPDHRLYLTHVFDTAVGVTDQIPFDYKNFAHHLAFSYESPSWSAPTTFRSPIFRALPEKRLVGIDVTSARYSDAPGQRELVRRYHLAYHEARERSYLDSVQVEGRCDTPVYEYDASANPTLPRTACLEQPATKFSYDAATTDVVWSPHTLTGTLPASSLLGDINTDGLPDFVGSPTLSGFPLPTNFVATVNLTGTLAPDNVAITTSITGLGALDSGPGAKALIYTTGNFLADGKLNTALFAVCDGTPSATCPTSMTPITPVASGSAWTWSAQPPVDLSNILTRATPVPQCDGDHPPSPATGADQFVTYGEKPYGVGDVDGDGFPDLLTSTSLVHTYCNLDVEGPPDQTGNAPATWFPTVVHEYVGIGLHATSRASNGTFSYFARMLGKVPPPSDPVSNLLPKGTMFMLVTDAASADVAGSLRVVPEDLNGDGLVDLINLQKTGSNVAYGSGDGFVHSATNPYPLGITLNDEKNAYVHDLNGDGLADIVEVTDSEIHVFMNHDGLHFEPMITEIVPSNVPSWTGVANAQVMFGDMNGSGVEDLVIFQKDTNLAWYADLLDGHRPGLLTSVDNGQGGVTTVQYASTTDLAYQAFKAGSPWSRKMGQVLHHVTSISSTNGLSLPPYGRMQTTQYAYRDPIYDAQGQRFVGFRNVRTTQLGDGDDPTQVVDTTYLSGLCDDSGASCGGSVNHPYLSLASKPVLVETSDGAGHYVSTVHTQWAVNNVALGVDLATVNFAYSRQVDTFHYDTTTPSSGAPSQAITDACVGRACFSLGKTPVRAATGKFVHLRTTQQQDVYGNLYDSVDSGEIEPSVDAPLHSSTTWTLPSGDTTGWLWRPHTRHTDPLPTTGAFADVPRDLTLNFDAHGNLQSVQAVRSGTSGLDRFDEGGRTTAPLPGAAAPEGLITLASYAYDAFGNKTFDYGANDGTTCEGWTYDPQYRQLVVADNVYTQSPASCSGAALTTSTTYDRGLAAPAMTTAPDFSYSTTTYDWAGRVKTVTKNASDAPALLGTHPEVVYTYFDYDSVARRPGYTSVQTWDDIGMRQTITFKDGMGSPLATFTQAAASDAPYNWVVSGVKQYGAKGHVLDQYNPFFTATNPVSFAFGGAPSAGRHTRYDAFGRAISTKGLTGLQDSETHYHALSTDTYDANNLPAATHAAYTSVVNDGHGRKVQSIVHGKVGSSTSLTTITTNYGYTATGQITWVTRSNGSTTTRQDLKYDSLDELVENKEPNSTNADDDWRYVYDKLGRLVATSDARGCGENIAYDSAGRKVGEDFSPCTLDHPDYTPLSGTNSATGGPNGFEIVFKYDTALTQTSPAPDGHLHAVGDRGSLTAYAYDARGRLSRTDRQIAKPGASSTFALGNYAANLFTSAATYDDADRVSTRTTGAAAPGMLVGGQSLVRLHYDARGHVESVDGSYGALIAATKFDADGLPLSYQYGDHAKTTSQLDYDSLRRLWHSKTRRPANWGMATVPGNASTQEEALEDLTIAYDNVGNPTIVQDASDTDGSYPTAWPAGARPIHKKTIGYDDLYHVKSVTYDSAGDSFTQPFAPEFASEATGSTTVSPVPATNPPSNTRVVSQTFDYDWLGNLTSSDDDQHLFYDRSIGIASFDPTWPNRMQGSSGAAGSTSVQYDEAGNLTRIFLRRSGSCAVAGKCTGEEFIYTWNEIGQLASARRWDFIPKGGNLGPPPGAPAVEIDYAYDGNGSRVLKTTSINGASPTYGAEIFPTLRLDGASWNPTTSKYQDDETTEGVYLVASKSPIARLAYATSDPHTSTSGALHVFFELKDTLGSSSFVIDRDTSELVERTTYQPYGAVEADYRTARWANFREPYKFSGKEEDIGVGVSYFGARYYAPALGRWLSPDPVAIHSLSGDLNLYGYAAGRVFNVTDPTGLYNIADNGMPDYTDWVGWESVGQQATQSIPNFDMMAFWANGAANATLGGSVLAAVNGFTNAVPDAINGIVGLFEPNAPKVPTLAPPAPSNPVEALAYDFGGMAGLTATDSVLGLSDKIAGIASKVSAWEDGASLASPMSKAGADLGDITVNPVPSGGCFTAVTSITTPRGARSLASVVAGDRVDVIGEEDRDGATAVDPRTWRDVHLHMPNPDGSADTIEVDVLRPTAWLDEAGATTGQWIPFGLPEMGLYGVAQVDAVEPIRHLENGPGRVVLATVTHLNGEIYEVRLAGAHESLTPTGTHWLYSADRAAWVQAKTLRVGERLVTADGDVAIDALAKRSAVERVYNIEVETAHSYLVGDARVLSHNVNPCSVGGSLAAEATESGGVADLGSFRSELGMEGGTLARLDIGGNSFYGMSGHGQDFAKPSGVTFQSLRHAEGDVFSQAANAGIRSPSANLFVDHPGGPCGFCRSSLAGYMRSLDIQNLNIVWPNGSSSISLGR